MHVQIRFAVNGSNPAKGNIIKAVGGGKGANLPCLVYSIAVYQVVKVFVGIKIR